MLVQNKAVYLVVLGQIVSRNQASLLIFFFLPWLKVMFRGLISDLNAFLACLIPSLAGKETEILFS